MSLHLWQDLVDNASCNDLAENGSFKSHGNAYLQKINPFAYVQDRLSLANGCAFDLFDGTNWRQVSNREEIDFDPATLLDAGSGLIVGTDYFVYLCKTGDTTVGIVVSANNTYPDGFDQYTSRKIGGFHYGHIRCVDEDYTPVDSTGVKFGASGTIWQNNVVVGIVPNSVWDLKNRPKTLFGAMVKVGSIWVSIYQASIKTAVAAGL
jgi:hypothetical protein